MSLPTYQTGTVSVAAGGTVVTGTGGIWTGTNVKQGDFISIAGSTAVLITEVTDTTHLKIAPWPGAAQSGAAYVIYQNYVGRVVGVAAAEDVGIMLEKLHTDGLPFILGADETVPDPSYGDEGQLAFKPSTGQWWVKQGGAWVPSSGLTALGYGGTSATSVPIGLSPPPKVFTTQTGLAYNGARVRAASAANLNNFMEGVATYSGTTLTMTADTIGGAGTFADWLFSIAGQKGAQGPAGATGAAGGTFPDAPSDTVLYGRKSATIGGAMGWAPAGGGSAGGGMGPPQGRLTLTLNTPVMTTSVAASPVIYYTPACGNLVPIYDGSQFVMTTFAELSQLATDATKSPAAVVPDTVYDMFVWNDAGTVRCTRGPVWTNNTTRSPGTALVGVKGLLLNNASITNGPAAQRGTYVGTVKTHYLTQTFQFIFGAPGAGGVAALLDVWNAYNRVDVVTTVKDTQAGYAYSSATIRLAGGGPGAVAFTIGLAEEGVSASYLTIVQTPAFATSALINGISLDSITAFNVLTQAIGSSQSAAGATMSLNTAGFIPAAAVGIGSHYLAPLEQADGTHSGTFNVVPAVFGTRIRM